MGAIEMASEQRTSFHFHWQNVMTTEAVWDKPTQSTEKITKQAY